MAFRPAAVSPAVKPEMAANVRMWKHGNVKLRTPSFLA